MGDVMSKLFLFLLSALMLGGCAHPIMLSPDIAKIERSPDVAPIDKSVGYFMISGTRELQTTSSGGGGDMVSFYPYKDLETSFYKMLSNVFSKVSLLKSQNDNEAIDKYTVRLIVTPQISTSSSSSSLFTWPPTRFAVTLTCVFLDIHGKEIARKVVIGEGQAEFEEFKSDFSLSARRASLDAMKKMQELLLASQELRN
jgi:hypothetical protein